MEPRTATRIAEGVVAGVVAHVAIALPGAVLGLLGPVYECLSLWPITGAGFAGALAMAAYLWRNHPRLRQALRGERYA